MVILHSCIFPYYSYTTPIETLIIENQITTERKNATRGQDKRWIYKKDHGWTEDYIMIPKELRLEKEK